MNKVRGQITLNIDGKDYLARLPVNSLCALEAVLDQETTVAVSSFINDAQARKVSFRYVRAFLWAMLLEADPSLTLDRAGALVDKATPKYVIGKIMEILAITFAENEEGEGRPQ